MALQPADEPTPEALLVRTVGSGSMDSHSGHLAAALGPDWPVLATDVYQRAAEQFARPAWSHTALRGRVAERRFVAALRDGLLPVHLPNHHLARYGPRLGRPYLVTVHDLIRQSDARGRSVHIHPPTRRDRRLLARDRAGILGATGLIAISRHTAEELERELGLGPERVAVVHPGIDHARFRPRRETPRPLPDPYVLFVGSEHPRKRLVDLLAAFAALKRRPRFAALRLVKVGAPGGEEAPFRARTLREIARLGLEREVILAGRVTDAELAAWYAHAACLVLPSLAEGFGLPPIEAMACGCPAIVTSAGALPETTGGAALVVPPREPRALAEAMTATLDRPELRSRLRAHGIARAAHFTWTRTAVETRRAYRRFLGDARAEARYDVGSVSWGASMVRPRLGSPA